MPQPHPVSLQVATRNDAELLENLLELYIHDMSEVFTQLEPVPNGRFGYPRLPLYWADPANRFAYLIKSGDRVAGFALVTRGSVGGVAFWRSVVMEFSGDHATESRASGELHPWRVFAFESPG